MPTGESGRREPDQHVEQRRYLQGDHHSKPLDQVKARHARAENGAQAVDRVKTRRPPACIAGLPLQPRRQERQRASHQNSRPQQQPDAQRSLQQEEQRAMFQLAGAQANEDSVAKLVKPVETKGI